MNCIVIDSQPLTKSTIERLIGKTNNLVLTGSFYSVNEAKKIMSKTIVDLIFMNLQIADKESIEFIKTIPDDIFVIFISDISSFQTKKQTDTEVRYFSDRFKKGISNAQNYQMLIKNETLNKTDDYFVI